MSASMSPSADTSATAIDQGRDLDVRQILRRERASAGSVLEAIMTTRPTPLEIDQLRESVHRSDEVAVMIPPPARVEYAVI